MTNATDQEEASLEELERRLAEARARTAEINRFTDPAMKALQLGWNKRDIDRLQEQIKHLEESERRSK